MTGREQGPAAADPEAIVKLRGERPQVVRLSRKAVAIAGVSGATLVGAALVYGLRPTGTSTSPRQNDETRVAVAPALASVPRDYGQVPRLGPPLPGDLGKPILAASERGAVAALPGLEDGTNPDDTGPAPAAHQRERGEREKARTSKLFAPAGGASAHRPEDRTSIAPSPQSPQAPVDEEKDNESQAALGGSLARDGMGWRSRRLRAGTIIPAALITGIRSDQAGPVIAQVTQNVYDSLTGRRLLVPQGTRLLGAYRSDVGFGQRRVELTWTSLLLEDGRTIDLEGQPATDAAGHAGLEDKVDHHWGSVFRAAVVSTLLGLGGELGSDSDDELARAVRRAGQDSVHRAGERAVDRELAVPPTLTIRPGHPVRVLLVRPLYFGEPT